MSMILLPTGRPDHAILKTAFTIALPPCLCAARAPRVLPHTNSPPVVGKSLSLRGPGGAEAVPTRLERAVMRRDSLESTFFHPTGRSPGSWPLASPTSSLRSSSLLEVYPQASPGPSCGCASRASRDDQAPTRACSKANASAAMIAAAGMVSTHAQTIFVATPQRTADSRCVAPTPMIAPVMVWVVDTGMPR